MPDKHPINLICDAQDKLNDVDNLAELIRLAGIGENTPDGKAMAHGAYLLMDAVQAAGDLLNQAKAQLAEGTAA